MRSTPVWIVALLLLALSTSSATSASAGPSSAERDDRRVALEAKADLEALAAFLRAEEAVRPQGLTARHRFLIEASSATSAFVRARAELLLARAEARRGDLEGARARLARVGFADQVLLVGPFENTGGARLSDPTAAEQLGLADSLTRGEMEGRPWQRVPLDPREGALDLGARLPAVDDVAAVAVVAVRVPGATTAAVRIATSGQVVVFAGGRERLRRDVDRPLGFDQDVILVDLPAGLTTLVFRLGNLRGPLSARIRVTAPDGRPLEGLAYSTEVSDVVGGLPPPSAEGSKTSMTPVSTIEPQAGAGSLADPQRAIEAFIKSPPLHRAPTPGGPDGLLDAITVEEEDRSRDQRAHPPPHQLWRLAYLLRLRTEPEGPARDVALADTLVAIGDSLRDHDPSQARARYEQALEVTPAHARALLGLARLKTEQEMTQDAVVFYRRAYDAAAGDAAVLAEALDGLRRGGSRELEVDRILLELAETAEHRALLELGADIAEQRGDLSRARRFGARLLAQDVVDPTGHRHAVGALEARLADASDADRAAVLDELVARLRLYAAHRPTAHRHVRKLALVLNGAGQPAEADEVVEALTSSFPALPEGPSLAAELALWRGERDAARAALLAALALAPQDRALRTTLRTLDEDGSDLAVRYALDVPALLALPSPPEAAASGAHLLARTVAARFYASGLGTVYEEQLIRILDAERAGGLGELAFSYAEGREVVEVLEASRLLPSGARVAAREVSERGPAGKVGGVYTDERSTVVDFGQVEAGDVLHVRVRKDLVGRQNLFGDFFGLIEPIGLAIPVAAFRLVVEVPEGRELAWGGRGAADPNVTMREGWRVHDFGVNDVARVPVEEAMPPWLDVADYLSVSSSERWEDLGDWYEHLIADQLVLDDELRRVAKQQTAGARTTEEKVRRLYEYVVGQTRYVGIELGIHGWRPYPVTEVHRRRYGDCKDKASLLIALLNAVGIEGRLALVRTADLGALEATPPSMWAFNHAIAYVPALDLYLDGTSEYGGYRELPPLDQGASALVVAPFSDTPPARVVLPRSAADENENASDYDLTLHVDGSLIVKGKERFRGAAAARERAALAEAGGREERLERALSSPLPGIAVTGVTPHGMALSSAVVGYDFEATLPHRATVLEDGALKLPISLYPHELATGWARRSTREHDVWLQNPWRTKNVMRYRLPAGWDVEELPPGGRVETPHLVFEQKITPTADGFLVEEDTQLKSRRIPVAEYEAFRRAAVRADALMTRAVVLRRRGSGA